MFKYKNRPLAAIIASYKKRHFPYTASTNYQHYIDSLASELFELKNSRLDLACSINYFQSYCYVYLNPLKKGKFKYVCPSGYVFEAKSEVFYVGKGIGDRAYDHLKEAEDKTNTSHKCRTIRKIWKAGLKPRIVIMPSRVSDFMACAFEIDLIAGIGRSNKKLGPLTNLTDGGDGTTGLTHSPESKLKIGMASKNRIVTEQTRLRMSQSSIGKSKSEKHREALSRARAGVKRKPRTKPNKNKGRPNLAMRGKPWSAARRAAQNTRFK